MQKTLPLTVVFLVLSSCATPPQEVTVDTSMTLEERNCRVQTIPRKSGKELSSEGLKELFQQSQGRWALTEALAYQRFFILGKESSSFGAKIVAEGDNSINDPNSFKFDLICQTGPTGSASSLNLVTQMSNPRALIEQKAIGQFGEWTEQGPEFEMYFGGAKTDFFAAVTPAESWGGFRSKVSFFKLSPTKFEMRTRSGVKVANMRIRFQQVLTYELIQ